ncbi:hypothetical protein HNP46_005807 [Pseudomonas nitritireducens]|uniref:Uncharacterized protein n=1 Tax=Pseudomonas nitroreducens TaxID=46680 RepID=A0A7W7P4Q8_PSENT|nr:hypothetical protein [Pseudomonas nitritireducens]MBB4866900.1 hypothetical protein [Pseudomonas nitritireducens]
MIHNYFGAVPKQPTPLTPEDIERTQLWRLRNVTASWPAWKRHYVLTRHSESAQISPGFVHLVAFAQEQEKQGFKFRQGMIEEMQAGRDEAERALILVQALVESLWGIREDPAAGNVIPAEEWGKVLDILAQLEDVSKYGAADIASRAHRVMEWLARLAMTITNSPEGVDLERDPVWSMEKVACQQHWGVSSHVIDYTDRKTNVLVQLGDRDGCDARVSMTPDEAIEFANAVLARAQAAKEGKE